MPITEFHGNELTDVGEVALIEFYTDWCPSCKAVKRTLEKFAEERDGLDVWTVNADENPELAKKFGIMSVPTFVVMKDGIVSRRVSGAKTINELRALI